MKKELSEYDIQANRFLEKTNTEIKIVFKENAKYFHTDKEPRDIYNITLIRGNRKYTFTFGNSLHDSGFYVQIGKTKHMLPIDKINSKNLNYFIKNNINSNYIEKIDKIHYPVPPSPYNILAGLEKYDYESFENFCDEYAYDTDSKSAERIYNACREQYLQLCSLYNEEEMEMLRDIL